MPLTPTKVAVENYLSTGLRRSKHWQGKRPDLTLIFDAPVAIGLGRWVVAVHWIELNGRSAFFERVRAMYQQIASRETDRVVMLDASSDKIGTESMISLLDTLEFIMSPWLDSSWPVLEGLQSKTPPHAWCVVHPPGLCIRTDGSTGPFVVMPKPNTSSTLRSMFSSDSGNAP